VHQTGTHVRGVRGDGMIRIRGIFVRK